ncbi:ABC transporter permease [Lacticaseibacillus jixiensis]|uniref:ABC transporter permease n=1 Tax=Lacticaseibacillus jixiensis TaxID=3231926 RepID=UPI0036F2A46B
MINQIRADLYRQGHSIGMAIITLLTIVYAVFNTQQKVVGGVTVNPDSKLLNQLIAKRWTVLDGIHAANVAGSLLLWLFIVVLVIVFSREFSQRTYKNTLVSGISRLQFILGKYLILLADILVLFALFFGTAAVTGMILGRAMGGSLVHDLVYSILLNAFFVSVVFSISITLMLSFNTIVVQTIFVGIWPLLISIVYSLLHWHWLRYLDFYNMTVSLTTGALSATLQARYLLVSLGLLIVSIAASSCLLQRKEL